MVVHAVDLVVAVAIALAVGSTGWHGLFVENRVYFLGGAFGVGIVYSIAKGISLVGASYSIPVLIVSQLLLAVVIDFLGLFGSPRIQLDWTKPLGLLVMVGGILIYRLRG